MPGSAAGSSAGCGAGCGVSGSVVGSTAAVDEGCDGGDGSVAGAGSASGIGAGVAGCPVTSGGVGATLSTAGSSAGSSTGGGGWAAAGGCGSASAAVPFCSTPPPGRCAEGCAEETATITTRIDAAAHTSASARILIRLCTIADSSSVCAGGASRTSESSHLFTVLRIGAFASHSTPSPAPSISSIGSDGPSRF